MRALILILILNLLLFGLPLVAADNPPGPEGKATVAFEVLRHALAPPSRAGQPNRPVI